ncbi:MAG: hypothetical protein GVY19_09690 [Bacteroidetes bacterium]|jgi:peptidyl-prolyl cis-trans isomerase SurA|nr:hypothetical protein [Bacteroidota bacterium]
MKTLSLVLSLLLSSFLLFGQDKDALILIDDHKVTPEEFMRVYKKNNNEKTISPKSIDEYMELYINFKLKVLEAQRLGYDTLDSFTEELSGYREKLAKPYFENEEVREELVKEAYERTVNEVEVSHIIFPVDKNATVEDTIKAYNEAMEVYNNIMSGEMDFQEAADKYHDGNVNGGRKGYLGYLNAFTTVYPFESAAYNTPVGEISEPIRTQFGYHIVKVHNRRKSPGELRAAHIFKRVNKNEPESAWEEAKIQIDSVYAELENGASFEELAKKHSDDSYTARRGGDVGWFKAGKMVPRFAEAAIDLEEIGDYTEPVRTDYGFHIIKLLDEKPVPTFDEMEEELVKALKKSNRNQLTKEVVVKNLKKDYDYSENTDNLQNFIKNAHGHVLSRQFDSINTDENNVLFTIDEKAFTQADFLEFLKKYRSHNKNNELMFINEAFDKYVGQEIIEIEDQNLEQKYPEFRYLVQEYHDGILLFNLMNDKVWNKAAEDTSGLEIFYEQNKDNYVWDERASISTYKYQDSTLTDELNEAALARARGEINKEELLAQLCDTSQSVPCVSISDSKIEQGQNDLVDAMEWESGAVSEVEKNGEIYAFTVINEILDPMHKKLNEARGLVISDYQNFLEDEWLYDLHNKYDIRINQKLLKKVKKGKYN